MNAQQSSCEDLNSSEVSQSENAADDLLLDVNFHLISESDSEEKLPETHPNLQNNQNKGHSRIK